MKSSFRYLIMLATVYMLFLNNAVADEFLEAATKGDLEVVTRLLGEGVDVNSKSPSGWTALHYAVWAGRADDPLVLSGKDDRLATVNRLLQQGAGVNIRDDDGETPLVWSYRYDIAKVLIDNGAQVNVRDKQGKTVLMHIVDTFSFINNTELSSIVRLMYVPLETRGYLPLFRSRTKITPP